MLLKQLCNWLGLALYFFISWLVYLDSEACGAVEDDQAEEAEQGWG